MRVVRMALVVVVAAATGAATGAQAEVDCTTAETQVDLTFCAEQDWQAADAALNAAYGVAMDLMTSIDSDLPKAEQGAAANLRDGQRAWITFRDASCAAEGFVYHGGSIEPMIVYGCRARLSWQRSEDLQAMATAQD